MRISAEAFVPFTADLSCKKAVHLHLFFPDHIRCIVDVSASFTMVSD